MTDICLVIRRYFLFAPPSWLHFYIYNFDEVYRSFKKSINFSNHITYFNPFKTFQLFITKLEFQVDEQKLQYMQLLKRPRDYLIKYA